MSNKTEPAPGVLPLDPVGRFALAYAPAHARDAWHGFLALERRLADAAQSGREPIHVQLRLAWWRDRFAASAQDWPGGEPLLALLGRWDAERGALGALVDGWEAAAVGDDGGRALAQARVEAMCALARLVAAGDAEAVREAARHWIEPQAAGSAPALPRAMRPLAVLRGLAVRGARRGGRRGLGDFLAGVRIGLTGR